MKYMAYLVNITVFVDQYVSIYGDRLFRVSHNFRYMAHSVRRSVDGRHHSNYTE